MKILLKLIRIGSNECFIDIIEGIDILKSNSSKECMICHYWFFNHGFKFQVSVCKWLPRFDDVVS